MKKLVLSVVALFAVGTSFAQEAKNKKRENFQVSVYGGSPVGMLNKHADINVGASVGYLGYINDIVRVGGSVGYDHTFTNSDSPLDGKHTFRYLMVGATAEVDVVSHLYVGADLGYAFKVHPQTLQSHYFTPKIGYRFSDNFNLYAHYKAVRFTGSQVASVGLGLAFDF